MNIVLVYEILFKLCFFYKYLQMAFLSIGHFLKIIQFQSIHFSQFAEPYFFTLKMLESCVIYLSKCNGV